MELHKHPFIRLLLPYMTAIWLYDSFIHKEVLSLGFGLGLFFLGVSVISYFFNQNFGLRWLFGFSLSLVFFALGWINTGLRQPSADPSHLVTDTTKYVFYYIRITEPPVEREKSVKASAELLTVFDGKQFIERRGHLMVYFAVDSSRRMPAYGQVIRIHKTPALVEGPKNPHQFDYRNYLRRKGICHQVYLKSEEWSQTARGWTNPLYSMAFALRDVFLRKLQLHHVEGDAFGVAAAILLGYDESLPAYLRQGYTAAGAMHVLCVSGLHVGIVFMFFNVLLSLVFRRHGQGFKIVLLLLLIWFYSLLTGLAPSVQRSAIMLSFVLLAKLFKRKGYVLNSIAASAFFILLFDPFVLFNIGFQLSYLAVIGIVLLQKPIYGLLYFRHKLPDKIWELSSVAIAAQLTTTPLVLHYFSQFPVYFLLGNLLLVPLSFVVIVSGMAFLLLSFVPYLADFAGWVTSALIWLMNRAVLHIEQLPGSVLKGLFIPWWESVLVFVIVACLYLILTRRKKPLAIALLTTMALLFSSFAWRSYQHNRQSATFVYNLNKHTAIHFVEGKTHYLVADSALKEDAFQFGFHLEKNMTVRGLNLKPVWINLDDAFKDENLIKAGPLMRTASHTLVHWDKNADNKYRLDKGHRVDYLVVSGHIKTNMATLIECLQPSVIILDASVPAWQAKQWMTHCLEVGQEIYNIRDQGAFTTEN